MPIWSDILAELVQSGLPDNPPDFDGVRRKYLAQLHAYSKRNIILYASGWLQKSVPAENLTSINDEDIQGFMEVAYGLEGSDLDLILHSPGGSLEAAEAIVSYLRSRFACIRVIVPQLAMSAATMVACAADQIWMGAHSFLGPTDPQLLLSTSLGVRLVPALGILNQFDRAQKECEDPGKIAAWLPMLSQYGPELLERCETVCHLSRELVSTWLAQFMFKEHENPAQRAQAIAEWLTARGEFKSHSRHIPRGELERQGLVVRKLENDRPLQDLNLSVFHATTHTFSGTPAVKIIENHVGRAFIKRVTSSMLKVPGNRALNVVPGEVTAPV